jgi:hypothetical protein
MEEKGFEGFIIGEKRFPFKRLTITNSAKMLKELLPSVFQSLRNVWFPYNEKKRWWIKVRNAAFERYGLWRIGIIPKELRCSVILPDKAEEAEESFFDYARAIVQELEKLSKYPMPLPMANKKQKETV